MGGKESKNQSREEIHAASDTLPSPRSRARSRCSTTSSGATQSRGSSGATQSKTRSRVSAKGSEALPNKRSKKKTRPSSDRSPVAIPQAELEHIVSNFIKVYDGCLNELEKALANEDNEAVKVNICELQWCDKNVKICNSGDIIPLLHNHKKWEEIKVKREKVEALIPCIAIQVRGALQEPEQIAIACTSMAGDEVAHFALQLESRVSELRECVRKQVPGPVPPPSHGVFVHRLIAPSGDLLDETKDDVRVAEALGCATEEPDESLSSAPENAAPQSESENAIVVDTTPGAVDLGRFAENREIEIAMEASARESESDAKHKHGPVVGSTPGEPDERGD